MGKRHEARAEDPGDLLQRKLEDCQRRFRLLDEQMRVLERERQKLSAVVNHTDAGFLVFDASLSVVWTNNIFATRFCASPSPAAVKGAKCHQVLCGGPLPCEICPAAQPFRSGIVAHQEMRLSIHEQARHIYATAMPIKSLTGKVEQTILMVQDLTDLDVLRQSEVRKSAILEAALDAIVSIDHEGTIGEFSPAAERMFGYRRAEVIGRTMADLLVPPSLRGRHRDGMARYLATGESTLLGRRIEMTAMRADGSEFPVEIAIARVPLPGAPMFTGFIRDLTEGKKVEESLRLSEGQLRQAQKMEAVGRLAGGVAHDFNNLLTVINGRSRLLLDGLAGHPLRKEVEVIAAAGDRAASLTRQLLAFSRRQIVEPRVIDLNTVVAETETMLRRVIGEDVHLEIRLKRDFGNVRADPGQIEQVIMNLVVNARDAMPQGGRLTIETANADRDGPSPAPGRLEAGRYVALSIQDTGSGMEAAVLSHLFEPYFTTKEKGKGTGLGLPTVAAIVKHCGGQIAVDSAPARGSRFTLYLPRVDEAAEEAPREARGAARSRGTETILVVEDETTVRELARELLQMSGYTVLEAGHGQEALRICRTYDGPIHLMLTDVVMPSMNGHELAETLAPLRPGMKVLYMSGYTEEAGVLREILDSDSVFLQKPFTPAALNDKIRALLNVARRN
ncbi:MAG TPA: PAS domain S-box protein [Candidatus Dormibacteraeota bacterium]|nr:PAS domain S-box protein [Candidatus Dormibacteraeota bacterium]